jgi:hypothetical protein
MASLRKFLTDKGFTRVKLKFTPTDHFHIKAKINGIEGDFILDTGASSSCIDSSRVRYFKLFAKHSDVKAAGAGATNMRTQVSENNTIEIGKWKKTRQDLVIFDLTHVNQALTDHEADEVDGIIGADFLKKGKAVIDYKQRALYLKT